MERQQTTTVNESEHSATWTLENFSQSMDHETGAKLISAPFVLGHLTFEFWLYPNGLCGATNGFVGLMMELVEPPIAHVKYSLSMGYDGIGIFQTPVNEETFSAGPYGEVFGDLRMAKHQTLLDQVLARSNDKLMIRCTIYGLDTLEACSRFRTLDNYEKLFYSEESTDVEIVIGDNVIRAHKLVLTAGSKIFASILQDSTFESKKSVVYVKDIDYDVMAELIRFLYSGKVSRCDVAKKLLVAAEKYALTDLVTLCGKQLQTNLTIDNIFEYMDFAQLHQADELLNSARLFLNSHAEEIIE